MLLTRLYQPLLWRKRPQWLFARHRLFSFRRQMVTEQLSLWSTIDHPLPFEKAKWFARWTRQRAKQSALYGSSQRSDFNFFTHVVTMWSQCGHKVLNVVCFFMSGKLLGLPVCPWSSHDHPMIPCRWQAPGRARQRGWPRGSQADSAEQQTNNKGITNEQQSNVEAPQAPSLATLATLAVLELMQTYADYTLDDALSPRSWQRPSPTSGPKMAQAPTVQSWF